MPSMNAQVATTNPARLINRLCKHFRHKIDAEWNEVEATLKFPAGECYLAAGSGLLRLECRASNETELETVGQIVSSHLIRFSGDEVEEVAWQPVAV